MLRLQAHYRTRSCSSIGLHPKDSRRSHPKQASVCRQFALGGLRQDQGRKPFVSSSIVVRTSLFQLRLIILLRVSLYRYWMDPYGTKIKVPYTANGLGVYVALSTMDKYWYPDITREEAGQLLKRCIDEVKLRE